jgi:hypothetical protein
MKNSSKVCYRSKRRKFFSVATLQTFSRIGIIWVRKFRLEILEEGFKVTFVGRRIMVLNQGKMWDPDVVNIDQIFRVLYISEYLTALMNVNYRGNFLFQFIFLRNLKSPPKLMVWLSSWTMKGFQ